mmetsp:Transcript_5745/g.6679  ORF Transcript_5745/g.6679 Transcript_5745/m.6679 type:complete len:616 (+) Transcript_5745:113-1960(+)|eukprot:CAMPEP_0198273342 /NCGR_PEP_ID=MMETSP1447-20131203/56627_1 /TAXON_ID=420782 /ORGANISM="Chaetoceros dichaeta, Strain CCMP1751" /LENGTH=615 /DNA_ID=CAMNT_0043966999 /DNA_START=78 /DNA_END=1925 /DNA_ORIENTATION=-
MKVSFSSASPCSTSKVASLLIFGVAIRTTTSFSSSNHARIPLREFSSFANILTGGHLSSSTQLNANPTSSSSSSTGTIVTKATANSPPSTQTRKSQATNYGAGYLSTLSMSSISDDSFTSQSSTAVISQFPDGIVEVLSAAFLITANTIGPSMMVVPKAMAGPGLLISGSLMTGVWGMNLFSALLIAEVAINQYETSSCDVPSSFKDFAEINLQSEAGGIVVSFLSIFVNWCVVSFNLIQMGEIVVANLPSFSGAISPISHAIATNTVATVAAVGWTILVGTQTNKRLSGVASLCCMGLFASFASILIPGLANVQSNPLSFAPAMTDISSMSESIGDAALGALPIFVAVMIFQNIVPTVVKMLDYDRKKCVLALGMGSVVPLLMHLSFSYAVLGGGIDLDLGTGGPLLNIFSTVSVVGSTMACIMSLAGEFGSFLDSKDECSVSDGRGMTMAASSSPTSDGEPGGDSGDVASIPALALAVFPPLLAGIYFSGGEEFVQAISISGSYASPLLYGMIPIILAWNQRKGSKSSSSSIGFDNIWKPPQEYRLTSPPAVNVSSIFQSILTRGNGERNDDEQLLNGSQELAPGGSLGLGSLGLASVLLISQSVMTDLGGMI